MRFIIVKKKSDYILVDLTKHPEYVIQESYVTDNEGIVGRLHEQYDDAMDSINDLITLRLKLLEDKLKKEDSYE